MIRKVTSNKTPPDDKLRTELVEEKRLGTYLRVFLGSSNGVRRETIVHRPVGITDLDGDEWVMSELSDITYLLSRTRDPRAQMIDAARSKWIEEQLLVDGLLKIVNDEAVLSVMNNPMSRAAYTKSLREAWKAAGNPNKSFDLATELSKSADPCAVKETEIRSRLATKLGGEADLKFKSAFRTCGGSREDRHQEAVKWAKGLTMTSVMDTLLNYGIHGPSIISSTDDEMGDTGSVSEEVPILVKSPGQENQKFFLPRSFDPKLKKEVRDLLKAIEVKITGAHADKKFIFSVHQTK